MFDSSSHYYKQVSLLVKVLGFVSTEPCFALKGGTAINLFVRDFPRLSVDIDLVYLPLEDREQALNSIAGALDRIAAIVETSISGVTIQKPYQQKGDSLHLLISSAGITVKVELSPVLRGVVNEPRTMSVVDGVEHEFGFAELSVVSFEDLYAGKLCAALDRQHPRDLYDIKILLENESITEAIRKTFIVYLISHNRPPHELLEPNYIDIEGLYENEFEGMAFKPVTLDGLKEARKSMVRLIHNDLTGEERLFLLSFYNGKPNWELLPFEHIKGLPAVKWKMLNLSKMSQPKLHDSICALKDVLDVS